MNNSQALKEIWMAQATQPTELDRQLAKLNRVEYQRNVCRQARREWQDAAEIAKARKKKYEAEVEELNVLLDEDTNQAELFQPEDMVPAKEPVIETSFTDAPTEKIPPDPPSPEYFSWSVSQLANYDVRPHLCDKLMANDFSTLRHVSQAIEEDPKNWWKQLADIGKKGAESIVEGFQKLVDAQLGDPSPEPSSDVEYVDVPNEEVNLDEI